MSVSKQSIAQLANQLAPGSITFDNSGCPVYNDTTFALESCHLSRSCCIGHLDEFELQKGSKIYSIDRVSGTFTSHTNALFLDNRRANKSGIRLLSLKEICSLNQHSQTMLAFLHDNAKQYGQHVVFSWVANSVPTGMLHALYSTSLDTLNMTLCSGGEYRRGASFQSG